jgi:hypothetical protein
MLSQHIERDDVYEERFSRWQRWPDRGDLENLEHPGVYVIAHATESPGGTPFSWRTDIIYIGMTNAEAGLRGRLKQFDNTILGKTGHGGADRVRYKHRDYGALCQRLFVAVAPFKCDVTSGKPSDLRTMGDVAQFEYLCFAHFAEQFGKLPEFNNKKEALKYSLTVGRGRETIRQQSSSK